MVDIDTGFLSPAGPGRVFSRNACCTGHSAFPPEMTEGSSNMFQMALEASKDSAALLEHVLQVHSKIDALIVGQERIEDRLGKVSSFSQLAEREKTLSEAENSTGDSPRYSSPILRKSSADQEISAEETGGRQNTSKSPSSNGGSAARLTRISVAQAHYVDPDPIFGAEAPARSPSGGKQGSRSRESRRSMTLKLRPLPDIKQAAPVETKKRGTTGRMRVPGETPNSRLTSGGEIERHKSSGDTTSNCANDAGSESLGVRTEQWNDMPFAYRAVRTICSPLSPGSKLVLCLDMFGMLLLCHDCVIIPYLLAWDQKMEGYFFYFAYISVFFWTTDLLRNFTTGFTEGDHVVKDLRRIVKRYLWGWFTLDFIIVFFDWMAIVIERSSEGDNQGSGTAYLKMVRLLKVTRMIRVARMYTMLKAGHFSMVLEGFMQKAHVLGIAALGRFVSSLLKLVFVIMWLNHLGACLWVGVQSIQNASNPHATKTWELSLFADHGGKTLAEAGLGEDFRYLFAYYWSITTMLTGETPLMPQTVLELAFTCAYVLLGTLFTSSIISYMAAMLMEGLDAQREKSTKIRSLEMFLQQQDVDPVLGVMVKHQVLERMTVRRRISEDDVPVITLLSAELRGQLRYNICSPLISLQPLWRKSDYVDDSVIRNLCRFAIRSITCEPGEVLFEAATHMDSSFVLVWGTMQYTLPSLHAFSADMDEEVDEEGWSISDKKRISGTSSYTSSNFQPIEVPDDEITNIAHGQQVCEIALWAEWQSLGMIEAVSPCELLECTSEGVSDVLGMSSRGAQLIMRGYSAAMVKYIEKSKLASLSDLSIDHDSVVGLMTQKSRILMSLPALKTMKKSWKYTKEVQADIEKEVQDGKCNLELDDSGNLLRVVRVVAMHVQQSDGSMIVQIGRKEGDKEKVSIEYPGMKMPMQESVADSAKKLLDKCLPKISSAISVDSWGTSVTVKASATFGIPTRYVRTVVQAKMNSSVDIVTKPLPWEHGDIVGFAFNEVGKADRLNVLAWMSEEQFEILSSSQGSSECPVSDWMRHFDAESGTKSVDDVDVAAELARLTCTSPPVPLEDFVATIEVVPGMHNSGQNFWPPHVEECEAQDGQTTL